MAGDKVTQPNNDNHTKQERNPPETVKKIVDQKDEINEWINDVQKGKAWNDQLQRLAQKLKKPGGEEKLKRKIKKFLKLLPSNFDADDEDGQRFRKQLPDYIVHKLMKIFLKQEKTFNPSVECAILEKEKKQLNLRSIIKAWVKSLPIMKKDILERPIKKDDILEYMIKRLEPFIIRKPDSHRDYQKMLISYVTEIANEIPLKYGMNKEKKYIASITNELVEKILTLEGHDLNSYKRDSKIKTSGSLRDINDVKNSSGTTEELENFVNDELMSVLKDSDIYIRKKLLAFIAREITSIFTDSLQSPGICKDDEIEMDVRNLLQEVGMLPEFQARYFSNELIKRFKNTFLINFLKARKRFGSAYSEACLVYNIPQFNFIQHRKLHSDKIDDTDLKVYRKAISSHIDHWLCSYRMFLPLFQHQTFRDVAVNELTEAIIKRKRYLEKHPSNRGARNEHEHIKFLIFKWIRKLVGEDNIEIIQHVPELQENIEKVIIPALLCPGGKLDSSKSYIKTAGTYEYEVVENLIKDLYEEILDWYSDLPRSLYRANDRKTKRQNIKNLANSIAIGFNTKNACFDEIIDKEVGLWAKKVLKQLPRNLVIEDLKARIKTITFEKMNKNYSLLQVDTDMNNIGIKTDFTVKVNTCTETQADYVNEVVDEINQWLAELPISLQDKDLNQEDIQNLALDIIDRYKYLKLNPKLQGTEKDELDNLKYQIYKCLRKVISENNIEPMSHAPELLRRLKYIFPLKPKDVTVNLEEKLNNCDVKNKIEKSFEKGAHIIRLTNSGNKIKCISNVNNQFYPSTSNLSELHENKSKTRSTLNKSSDIKYTEPTLKLASRAVGGQCVGFSNRHGLLIYSKNKTPSKTCRYVNNSTDTFKKCYHTPDKFYYLSRFQQTEMEEIINPEWEYNLYPYHCNNCTAFTTSSCQNKPFTQNLNICYDTGFASENCSTDLLSAADKNMEDAVGHTKSTSSSKIQPKQESFDTAVPTRTTLSQIYEYFDQMFRKRCEELPIDDSNFEQKMIDDETKMGINNMIWKTFFSLKADPSIESNYKLFVAILDDKLDILLDFLPRTEQISEMRIRWKNTVIQDVLTMLDCVHKITESMSYKQQLADKFCKNFIKSYARELSSNNQYLLAVNIVDAYILFMKYETENHTKANIYKQILIKEIENVIEDSRAENKNFQQLDLNTFFEEAIRLLNSVPLPDNETLQYEANKILMANVIEQWYNDMLQTTTHPEYEQNYFMEYQRREILTRNLIDIEKKYKADETKCSLEILRETTEFLQTQGFLGSSQDLLIKADDLTKRLAVRRRRLYAETLTSTEGGEITDSWETRTSNLKS